MTTDSPSQFPRPLGIGIVGAGYMGKRHAVAMQSVGATFNTRLRPHCELIATTTAAGAARARDALGFKRSTADWRELVDDTAVQAVVIASPQATHVEIAERAFKLGKPVLCEKPLGTCLADSERMVAAAEAADAINMVGFNYIRTPASQYARQLIANGAIGDITWFRGEHTEDFLADPDAPANWRTEGRPNGTMGDLAPHMINGALALIGSIDTLCADIETVHATRPTEDGPRAVTNDDHAHVLCRFTSGVMGHLYFSRVSTGRKMGYAYEISGTDGAIRFDQEDQNALWLYERNGPAANLGFRKILTNADHPDYGAFCEGPGHGTGYQAQLTIEARDFIESIADGESRWPTFRDGMEVSRVVDACWRSHESRSWVSVCN